MTTDARLSVHDIALLRRVIAWARAEGWRWTWAITGAHTFTHDTVGEVELSAQNRYLTAYCWSGPRQEHFEFWPRSVAEAVDVLVALGILPPELSSQWNSGYDAGFTVGDRHGYNEGHADGYGQGRDDEAAEVSL